MGRVMGLVNDLILRRDRDAEQRENLSTTIRGIRADSLRLTTDHERLQTKHAEAQRRLGLAEATERALKLQLKSAEQAARGLKEEMARMRVLVGQTRAQCANEVRKRERMIEGLKKHVGEGGRQRGSGKTVGITTINVVAGVGDEKASAAMSIEESGYDLRTETNEFLTELARGLSEENEHLGGLVRRTISTLHTLSGYRGQQLELQQSNGGLVQQIEGSYDVLAGEMDEVIAHLQTLLTNPSFVPLEEVEVREDEIIRLREGWEKMESRWKEAVQMMDGWRKRMARTGQTINLEELQQGLRLSPVKVNAEGDPETNYDEDDGEGDTQADIDAMDDSGLEAPDDLEEDYEESLVEGVPEETADVDNINSSTFYVQPLSEQEQAEQDAEEEDDTFNTSTSSAFSPPNITALRETFNNANRNPPSHNAFTTIIEENTWDLAALQTPTKSNPTPQPTSQNPQSASAPTPNAVPGQEEEEEEDSIEFLRTPIPPKRRPSPTKDNVNTLKPPSASSRLPRPATQAVMQSPLTMASIAAKLAATEREADAARVRAKLKAARAATRNVRLSPPRSARNRDEKEPVKSAQKTRSTTEVIFKEQVKAVGEGADGEGPEEAQPTRKRKATGRAGRERASRRRSTLSPWELESLILGGVSPMKASPAKREI